MKPTNITKIEPQFSDVKHWYDRHMSGNTMNYDDQDVYKYVYHDARWCGIFQLTSKGAQNLFKKAKPKSIIDIAALTSIFRPGPLASNVDKMYLEAGEGGKAIDWGHPAFDKVLGSTRSLLIFQEQMMALAEEVGGFSAVEADMVRKAIAKRSISTKDAAAQKMKELEERFVAGAKLKGISESVSRRGWDLIQKMSGYGFNVSHAVAYAIDSYNCAWLLTYYEEEWLTAYLEGMSVSDEKRAKAFGEVKALGYEIVPIDAKYAGVSWTAIPGKKFMPSMLSCKGVGGAAIEEFNELRNGRDFIGILYDDAGQWRPSKFNKRALEALINVGAWGSYDIIGKDKLFDNYKHMHTVLIEHNGDIKKSSTKNPKLGKENFYALVEKYRGIEDWSRTEYIKKSIEHFGSADINSVVPQSIRSRLIEKGIRSIDEWEEKDLYWFVVKKATPKNTKGGKPYILLECQGPSGQTSKMFVWSWDGRNAYQPYTVLVAEIDKSDFGYATSLKKIKELNV